VTVVSSTPWTRALALATVVVSGVTLSGCSLIDQVTGGGDATRADNGEVIEGNENTDVFTLRVGDCLNDATASETVDAIATVPCSEPHDSEIYASFVVEGDTFPGTESLLAQAEEACLGAFPDFVGIPYADSIYFYSYYFPTEGSWNDRDDREVLCTIFADGVQTTGSLSNISQ
jgi:hypothetical protein